VNQRRDLVVLVLPISSYVPPYDLWLRRVPRAYRSPHWRLVGCGRDSVARGGEGGGSGWCTNAGIFITLVLLYDGAERGWGCRAEILL
jgi:hypothetical protein